MPKIRHPLSGAVYDLVDGLVTVEKNGQTGRFRADGAWVSGDVRTADPEMCRWLSDPRFPSRHRAVIEAAASAAPTTGEPT